jgi:SAM-dependent methyltransferase
LEILSARLGTGAAPVLYRGYMSVILPFTVPRDAEAEGEYRPFPDIARRNSTQEQIEVPALVRLMGLPARARMLEVGCGRGVALPVLARKCRPSRLVGLDVDRELLEEARTRCGAELIHGDVRDLPFPDASFDVVIDFGTCYHIARPEAALREIARVLAQGGVFVSETPLSQLLSHPVRSFGRRLPWEVVPELAPARHRGLWSSRVKKDAAACQESSW